MRFTIYSDLHYYSPHQMNVGLLRYGPNVVYLGDVWDRKNARKSQLKEINKDFLDHYRECRKTRSIYVSGNHELVKHSYHEIVPVNDVNMLVLHGDHIDYGKYKMEKWRSKTPGISSWKWHLRKIFGGKKRGRKTKLSEEIKNTAVDLAREHLCSIILFGHYHLRNIVQEMHQGVYIISVPRGVSTIEIPGLTE